MSEIKFKSGEDIFYSTLSKRVNDYFIGRNITRYANARMKVKIFFLATLMCVSYGLLFIGDRHYLYLLLVGFCFGLFSFFTCLNIAHDAAHGALSKNKTHNEIGLSVMNMVGINAYIWKLKHLFSHHTFPNVIGTDSDIGESKIGRIIPKSKWKWFCKYQHYYIPFLYLFYSAHWVLFKDFRNFKKLVVPNKKQLVHSRREYFNLIQGKVFAIAITFLVPLIFLKLSILNAVGLYLVMHLGPGLCVALFLAPGHLNMEVAYPLPDSNGTIDTTWAEHQIITAIDFSTDNKIYNFLLGGFNHHISHHLFPTICHCHYPEITPIIKRTAKEFNINYRSTSFGKLLRSHLTHLKKMSIKDFDYEVI